MEQLNFVGKWWRSILTTLLYVLLTITVYFFGQTIIVLLHEYAHSSAAWLLGYSSTPFTVVWGNPLTMRGWDEGVSYDQLFSSSVNPAESVIGGIPLLMHAVFAALGLILLLRSRVRRSRLPFLLVYWFVVANLAELVAYLWMRPFIPTGDTGRFNAGLGLTPWPLFLVGTVLLFVALALLVCRAIPVLDQVAGEEGRWHWMNVLFTGFFIFLWASGFRILLLYPDPQWRWGLIGFAAFGAWMLTGRLFSRTRSGL